MTRIFSIALIVGIMVIAGFSAFAIGHASEHGHISCLSAAVPVTTCPANIIAMFVFHAGILKSLLLAIASDIAFIAISLVYIIVFVFIYEKTGPPIISRQHTPLFFFEKLSFSQAPFMRWLCLHENSPSFA